MYILWYIIEKTQISHNFSKAVFFITVCAEKLLIFKK